MHALGLIGLVGGTALAGISQIQQGYAAKAAYEANAEVALQEGQAKREAYKSEGLKLSREQSDMLEEQKSLYGASGIDISSGSPLDVMAKSASSYERDIGHLGIAAGQAYAKAENEASIYRYMGKKAVGAGWLGAGATLLGGLGVYGLSKLSAANKVNKLS